MRSSVPWKTRWIKWEELWDWRNCPTYRRKRKNLPLTSLRSRTQSGPVSPSQNLPSPRLYLSLPPRPHRYRYHGPRNPLSPDNNHSDNNHLPWRLASHVINKFTEMLRYVRCARQRVVPATLRNQRGSWTSECKKSLPQQFMCTSSSRQVDGVFSRQIGGACGSDWEGASKP